MIFFQFKRVFTVALILISGYSIFGQGHRLKFEIKGAAGLSAELAYYMGENKYVYQKGIFDKNGKLILEGKDRIPTGIYLLIVGNNGYFDLLIRNEQSFSISSDTSDFIRKMKVKDSKENDLFFGYQLKVLDFKTQLSEYETLIKKSGTQDDSVKILMQKKEAVEKDLNVFVDKTINENKSSYLTKILKAMDSKGYEEFDFTDEEMLRTPFYHNYIRLFIKKNIEKSATYIIAETESFLDKLKSHKTNYEYTAGYLLNFYNTFYKVGMNQVFVFIADTYFLPDKAGWLTSKDLEQVKQRRDYLGQSLPGNKAMDLVLESTSGEYISLLQLNARISLLYFWSTGCGHCSKSTEILKNNYKELSSKGIEIYAVNVDKNRDEWKKKVEENELPWINCYDPDNVSDYRDKYYVYGSPLLYVIDEEKNILAIKNGEIEIEEAVNTLLKK